MLNMLIGLCGKKGSGKSTVAEYLENLHGFVEFKFADALKDIVSIIFGFDRQMLEGLTKEHRQERETLKDEVWNITPRKALQYIGTDLFRDKFDEQIWIKILIRKIKESEYENIVISDVRFKNEFDILLKLGAKIIGLKRETKFKKDFHTSEIEIDELLKHKECNIIKNNGSFDSLFEKVYQIIKK